MLTVRIVTVMHLVRNVVAKRRKKLLSRKKTKDLRRNRTVVLFLRRQYQRANQIVKRTENLKLQAMKKVMMVHRNQNVFLIQNRLAQEVVVHREACPEVRKVVHVHHQAHVPIQGLVHLHAQNHVQSLVQNHVQSHIQGHAQSHALSRIQNRVQSRVQNRVQSLVQSHVRGQNHTRRLEAVLIRSNIKRFIFFSYIQHSNVI